MEKYCGTPQESGLGKMELLLRKVALLDRPLVLGTKDLAPGHIDREQHVHVRIEDELVQKETGWANQFGGGC